MSGAAKLVCVAPKARMDRVPKARMDRVPAAGGGSALRAQGLCPSACGLIPKFIWQSEGGSA